MMMVATFAEATRLRGFYRPPGDRVKASNPGRLTMLDDRYRLVVAAVEALP